MLQRIHMPTQRPVCARHCPAAENARVESVLLSKRAQLRTEAKGQGGAETPGLTRGGVTPGF